MAKTYEELMQKTVAELRAEIRALIVKDESAKRYFSGYSSLKKVRLAGAMATWYLDNPDDALETEKKSEELDARVEQVKAASTAEAIEAILKECTRAEMVEILRECTDGKLTLKHKMPKAELARDMAKRIEMYREQEEFRALTVDAKYEYLMSQTKKAEIEKVTSCLTDREILEIASRLGFSTSDSFVKSKTLYALKGYADANFVEKIARTGDIERLRKALEHTVRPYGLRILCDLNGLEVIGDLELDSDPTREKLIEHYLREMGIVDGMPPKSRYQQILEELTCKSEAELRAKIEELRAVDDSLEYAFEGYTDCPKAELVSELADWYISQSPDAVGEAIKVIETSDSYPEKHAALLKCTGSEMFEVMRECTCGQTKLWSEYDSHEALAWLVLFEIVVARGEIETLECGCFDPAGPSHKPQVGKYFPSWTAVEGGDKDVFFQDKDAGRATLQVKAPSAQGL